MNKLPSQLANVFKEPKIYKFSKFLQKTRIRGGYRLENYLASNGWLDCCVRYELANNILIDIPIAERSYNLEELIDYESASIINIASIVETYGIDFCLLDCGADIGVMSAKFVSAIPSIKKVIAFEPNKVSFKFLEKNLGFLNINAVAKNMGVSNFNGKATLELPEFDKHDHAAFVVPDDEGDFEVTTIDQLAISGFHGLLFKVDVEGAELEVIKGAEETISSTQHVVMLFEAHPKQVDRSGTDPVEIIKYFGKLKSCHISVMEYPDIQVNLNKPFFDQFPDEVLNICLYSK